ncbi:MAG: hypothetical protein N3B18_08435 [Desulfobacterota bacterium]|nr:hypothetical protein [Thermodesulfobacteriota bacterium]
MEILFEDINHKFDLILKGHDLLSKKIDAVRDDLNDKIEMNTLAIKGIAPAG